jgi:3-hydroxyacyl-CoA dehydrogenase/3a,7a,12a-trihydroxy-5b-cholest-24-enoyl-CoA hydratase
MSELRFDGRVAVVTGAGGGLGRSHALLLAKRGCKVVVNDLGGSAHGEGKSGTAADAVVREIKEAGGEAVANYDSVEDGAKIVQCALDSWKRIDIVVNNAGILRDTSFQKMSDSDWDLVYRVHVLGAYKVTRAAWDAMRDASYGRIVMTASAAGIYGNFGQANYSTAKLGLVGFANTLAIEGKKKNIFTNVIAPIAGSRLTETILPKELTDALRPEYVSPLLAYLCHESCNENGGLFEVGGGFFAKLRYQRTLGHSFRSGRSITPEDVADQWKTIVDFGKANAPADVTESMQPILSNLSKKSLGGNEFIDLDLALGHEFEPVTSSYDERDLALYALGVGAAADPTDQTELQYVYELHKDGFRPLATFGVIPALSVVMKMAREGKQAPGLKYGFERILHGEQYTELKRPLPPKATLTHKAKIKDIFDKGRHAAVVTEIRSFDEQGNELTVNELVTIVRGAGGWGGDRGPAGEGAKVPAREPDVSITEKVGANQALLYRLSGDWNPLHVDPSFASMFGFQKPILHGLCTFGYAGRHVTRAFAKGDPRLVKSIRVRFSDTVFPGDTLRTDMWKESDTRILFQTVAVERDKPVITGGVIELHPEVPKDLPKAVAVPAPKAEASVPANYEASSADIFTAIADHIERNPDLTKKIATVFVMKLTGPDSAWTIDVKNGKGGVTSGAKDGADVTLELSDADFVAMSTGKADAQKLYFAGKMKISGNVMASQKLMFLKDIKPEDAARAVMKARGGSKPETKAAAPQPAADVVGTYAPTSGDVFIAIRDHIERNPDIVGKIATVFVFKLTAPDTAWTIDLKAGKGAVTEGAVANADVTLELSDADFVAMSTGKADAQKLYFAGKMKIAGNIMASQKLMFLKDIKPEDAARAVMKAKGLGTQPGPKPQDAPPAPTTAPRSSNAEQVFRAMAERFKAKPALGAELGAIIHFRVTGDGTTDWTVDGTASPPTVSPGKPPLAATSVVTLSDGDLGALAAGKAAANDLFQRGSLRIDGDMGVAHRFGLLMGP